MKTYDIIVIGSGGGAKIYSPAARLGKKVALIDNGPLGGTCLNRGCIPSKMLIHPADVAMEIKEAKKFDIHNNPDFEVDFSKLVGRISSTVDGDAASVRKGVEQSENIDFYPAKAKFVSNKVIEVNGEQLTAEQIFIVAGARPSIPDITGLKDTPYWTSTEALRSQKLPKKMIVLGGGYIGLELGFAYSALGSDVHFIVRSEMLRHEDFEVREEFRKEFTKHHTVHFGFVPSKVVHENGTFKVTIKNKDGAESIVEGDALLVATGVVPNTDLLEVKNTDIEMSPNGYIHVNDKLETSVPGVFAFGDIIGRYLFRHTVNWEGEYLFHKLYVKPHDKPINYGAVPHAVFTRPQIAGAGKTEDELKMENVEYVVGLNAYKSSAMGMALLSDHGFVKLLIGKNDRKILGVHVIGPEASDMVHMVIALMYKEGTVDDLLNMIYIHPALPEIVRNAARKAKMALDGHLDPI